LVQSLQLDMHAGLLAEKVAFLRQVY
jgi:hypothetical protein